MAIIQRPEDNRSNRLFLDNGTPYFECSTGKLIANNKYITAETSLSTAIVNSGLSRLQELPIISVYDIFALTLNPDKQDKGENKLIF